MLRIKLSHRGRNTPPSPIRKLAHLAVSAKKAGTQVLHLNIGQPDIESPQEFFDGLALFRQRVVAYEQSQGYDALCAACPGT
jgi:aspartate aminotransferase